MLISPTEPQRLRELGQTSSLPETFGCDFLIVHGPTRIGVQRKKFPDDFLSSLADGRLYTQIPQMAKLEHRVIVLEGYGKWTEDGELIGTSQFQRFNMQQMYGLMFSVMFLRGTPIMWVRDVNATMEMLIDLEAWLQKEKHTSLMQRPGVKKDSWGVTESKWQGQHILQGFPGVGPGLADRIIEHFGGLPLQLGCTVEELMEVPGVGKKKAEGIVEALK